MISIVNCPTYEIVEILLILNPIAQALTPTATAWKIFRNEAITESLGCTVSLFVQGGAKPNTLHGVAK